MNKLFELVLELVHLVQKSVKFTLAGKFKMFERVYFKISSFCSTE